MAKKKDYELNTEIKEGLLKEEEETKEKPRWRCPLCKSVQSMGSDCATHRKGFYDFEKYDLFSLMVTSEKLSAKLPILEKPVPSKLSEDQTPEVPDE